MCPSCVPSLTSSLGAHLDQDGIRLGSKVQYSETSRSLHPRYHWTKLGLCKVQKRYLKATPAAYTGEHPGVKGARVSFTSPDCVLF